MPRVILTYADWDRIATALEGWVDEVGSEQVAGFEETRDKVLALIEEVNACGIETTDEAC